MSLRNTRLAELLPVALLVASAPSFALAQKATATGVKPSGQTVAQSDPAAADPKAIEFANRLLKQMTLQEKIGQMSLTAYNSDGRTGLEDRIARGEVGSVLFVTDPIEINRLQKIAVSSSRLHIPLLIGFDVIHGFRTIYPVPLAMAASWDPSVAQTAQRMAAREASSVGIRWAFAPMVDIARDPRWGRIMEGAGEDPYLGSRMAEAQVRGFQGERLDDPTSVLACVKHFAGYGAVVGGRDYDTANISDEQLWNVYLPPFKAALDAGAGSIMSAYMDLNGIPATGNSFLLHDVLRERWHFNGFTVSDWASVQSLTAHGFSANDRDAAVRAVNAGVDLEMTTHVYQSELPDAVAKGEVQLATIDAAARDVLVAKYRLGMFRHVLVDPLQALAELVSPAQRAAARTAAARSAVLLRNQAHLLPLAATGGTIAVVGPLADAPADTMGSWSLAGHPGDTVTMLDGLRQHLGSGREILYTKGVEIFREQPSIFDEQFPSPKPTLTTEVAQQAEFNHAIDLIKQSKLAILVLGEAQTMSGEQASRSTLSLPGRQQNLLEAAVATGTPVVLVLMNARPLDLTWASEHVPAILEVWYPGTEGGNAVADLLTGSANPGGKLPLTWPRSVGQVPLYYGDNLTQDPSARDRRYWDATSAPLYPFGFGLSYSSFVVDGLKTSSPTLHRGESLTASVDINNDSSVGGDEVVQLYIHQRAGSASRPARELKAFRRVHFEPHQKQTVSLTLKPEELAFWSPQQHRSVTEPGDFDLWVGTASDAPLHSKFTLIP